MAIVRATLKDNRKHSLTVQFNPESLSVNHRTSGERGLLRPDDREGSGEERAGRAAVSTGYSASLTMDLLFDTSDANTDVRKQTLVLIAMMQPDAENKSPLVTFQWATFTFVGHITSVNETLSYFSDQGVPLRATASVSMTKAAEETASNAITGLNAGIGLSASASFGVSAGVSAGASVGGSVGASASASVSAGLSAGASIGTTPLTFPQGGESLQSLAGRAGADWRAVAQANNVDNPRTLQTGAVVNLNVKS